MSIRPSTSAQFSKLNETFNSDCCELEKSIRRLKHKAAGGPRGGACCKFTCDDAPLASRAKDLRNTTEKRFSEVIAGWKNQSAKLEKEVEIYKAHHRIGAERLIRRNEEIEKLQNDNANLRSLLTKSKQQIEQLFDSKEKEKQERLRADTLANKLFEHKSMIHDLQTQLKEAEQLLEMTRTKRDSLIIENGGLIKKNCGLRQRLKATERDTSETKLELEMIEDLDTIGYANLQLCIEPRKTPSALTALNILQTNHDDGICMLNNEVKKLKKMEKCKTAEIERLRCSLYD